MPMTPSERYHVTVKPVGIHAIHGTRSFVYTVECHWIEGGWRNRILYVPVNCGDSAYRDIILDKYPGVAIWYQPSLPFDEEELDQWAWF